MMAVLLLRACMRCSRIPGPCTSMRPSRACAPRKRQAPGTPAAEVPPSPPQQLGCTGAACGGASWQTCSAGIMLHSMLHDGQARPAGAWPGVQASTHAASCHACWQLARLQCQPAARALPACILPRRVSIPAQRSPASRPSMQRSVSHCATCCRSDRRCSLALALPDFVLSFRSAVLTHVQGPHKPRGDTCPLAVHSPRSCLTRTCSCQDLLLCSADSLSTQQPCACCSSGTGPASVLQA